MYAEGVMELGGLKAVPMVDQPATNARGVGVVVYVVGAKVAERRDSNDRNTV